MAVNTLFLDMNSFFASVEQQDRPALRGKPVAVAAVLVDSTACIAASYEAKALGVRTGITVGEARRACPLLKVLEARPQRYTEVHHRIVAAVERCLPVARVDSIDELWCRLTGPQRDVQAATSLARRIKRAILEDVGEALRCSVGLAGNRVLAKVAAGVHKPDGLTVIDEHDLPHKLYGLALDDLPGVGPGMLARLHRHGIHTVEALCAADEATLRHVWGGVTGAWWWCWLRGEDPREPAPRRSTVGHSHVLPPALRKDAAAHDVFIRLIHKSAARLRAIEHWARRMEVYISFSAAEEGWSGEVSLGQCRDTLTMIEAFEQLWAVRPRLGVPTQVAVTLFDLTPDRCATLPLFPEAQRRSDLAEAVDTANAKLGPRSVYFAPCHAVGDAAPTRIAFSQVPRFDPRSE